MITNIKYWKKVHTTIVAEGEVPFAIKQDIEKQLEELKLVKVVRKTILDNLNVEQSTLALKRIRSREDGVYPFITDIAA